MTFACAVNLLSVASTSGGGSGMAKLLWPALSGKHHSQCTQLHAGGPATHHRSHSVGRQRPAPACVVQTLQKPGWQWAAWVTLAVVATTGEASLPVIAVSTGHEGRVTCWRATKWGLARATATRSRLLPRPSCWCPGRRQTEQANEQPPRCAHRLSWHAPCLSGGCGVQRSGTDPRLSYLSLWTH